MNTWFEFTFGQERIQSWTVHNQLQSREDRVVEETADGELDFSHELGILVT